MELRRCVYKTLSDSVHACSSAVFNWMHADFAYYTCSHIHKSLRTPVHVIAVIAYDNELDISHRSSHTCITGAAAVASV
jgi:hypothetical protein